MNMNRVYKYTLYPDGKIEMPLGAEILSTAFQGEELQIWAVVDMEEERKEDRYFHVFGTGHDINIAPESMVFVGTVFLNNLVFHVFEY